MTTWEQLDILRQGVDGWNAWRQAHADVRPHLCAIDLSKANLRGANLGGANLKSANLMEADLTQADLSDADLRETKLQGAVLTRANLARARLGYANLQGADLQMAFLQGTDFFSANLTRANLTRAILRGAFLSGSNLTQANLSKTDLQQATLVATNVEQATLTGCSIYGFSAWNIRGRPKEQSDLVITPNGELTVTVDNLKIAQFIYLLLNNAEIRDVIQTVARKAVLILGRFTEKRKVILNAIREELRTRGWLPIMFDFSKPDNRDLTETITTLAHLSRFIIADLTDAKAITVELQAIVPHLPSVPVQPLLLASAEAEYELFDHIKKYASVLKTYRYENESHLVISLPEHVIAPAEAKAKELQARL